MKYCIIGGYLDTRTNNEDFAITPYLFSVIVNHNPYACIKVYGIGICWGFYSAYIGIGVNIPLGYRGFRKIIKRNTPAGGGNE